MAEQFISRYDAGVKRSHYSATALAVGALAILATVGVGVTLESIAAGGTGTVAIAGRFDAASASGTTFSVGDPVYWDSSTTLAVKTSTSIYLGLATKAKVSGETRVEVDLNVQPPVVEIARACTSAEGTANYVDIDVGFDVGSTAVPKCSVIAQFRSTADGTVYSTGFAITHNPGSAAATTVRIAGTDITTSHIIAARIKRLIA